MLCYANRAAAEKPWCRTSSPKDASFVKRSKSLAVKHKTPPEFSVSICSKEQKHTFSGGWAVNLLLSATG
jgi:hypothetical protein